MVLRVVALVGVLGALVYGGVLLVDVGARVRTLQEQVGESDARVEELAGAVSAAQAETEEVRRQLDAVERGLTSIGGRVESAEDGLAGIGERVGSVEGEVSERSGAVFDVQGISAVALESVVTVHCGTGLGSGFAYDVSGAPSGYRTAVVTNYHVIEGCTYTDGPQAWVEWGGREPGTQLWTWDVVNDLALLWVDSVIPPLADAAEPRVGDPVLAIGSPLGLTNTVTQGIVSNVYSDAIQTDASVDHGNSGGPLVGRNGGVLGVITLGLGDQNTNIAWRTSQLCIAVLNCP